MATARLRSAALLRRILLRNFSVEFSSYPRALSRTPDVLQVPQYTAWRHFSTCKPNYPAKQDTIGLVPCLYGQTRWASQAAAVKQAKASGPEPKQVKEDDEYDKDYVLVYQGPISSIIKKMKLVLLSTCCINVLLYPVTTSMIPPDMNVILPEGAIASTAMSLSVTKTALLSSVPITASLLWLSSPYVHKLWWSPGSDSFEAEMISWLATPLKRTFKFADIRPPKRNGLFVTFKAGGNSYFLELEHVSNKDLLDRLRPLSMSQRSTTCN